MSTLVPLGSVSYTHLRWECNCGIHIGCHTCLLYTSGVNNEFKSNIEQIDTIKASVTNLKSKQTKHEQEIIKVREDLSLAINQKLTNVSDLSLIHICITKKVGK